jgi:hypothetical protein
MDKSRWISDNPKDFVAGDIICNKAKQDFLRLVVYSDDNAIWVTGLVHCALTKNNEIHPIFPMYFDEIERGIYEPLLRLGNLKDYSNFINDVHMEVLNKVIKERF